MLQFNYRILIFKPVTQYLPPLMEWIVEMTETLYIYIQCYSTSICTLICTFHDFCFQTLLNCCNRNILSPGSGWLFLVYGCSLGTPAGRCRPAVTAPSVKRPGLRRTPALDQCFSTLASTRSQATECLCGASASPALWASPASWCLTAAGRNLASTS